MGCQVEWMSEYMSDRVSVARGHSKQVFFGVCIYVCPRKFTSMYAHVYAHKHTHIYRYVY